MAQDTVNLLKTDKLQVKKKASFFYLSILVLLIVVLITVLILLYLLFLKSSIASTINSQNKELSILKSEQGKKIKILTTKERLATIKKIVPGNSIPEDRLNIVLSSIPASISIDKLEMIDTVMNITISSISLSVLNTFLNSDLSELPKKKDSQVKKIEIQSFGLNSKGTNYSSDIKITFNTSIN
jgi:type II secretory pathway component PulM